MINLSWSYLYNKLHDYYSNLEIEGHITELEMEDYLDIIQDSTLDILQDKCIQLELIDVPTLKYMG